LDNGGTDSSTVAHTGSEATGGIGGIGTGLGTASLFGDVGDLGAASPFGDMSKLGAGAGAGDGAGLLSSGTSGMRGMRGTNGTRGTFPPADLNTLTGLMKP
jgi:hypothetical protein